MATLPDSPLNTVIDTAITSGNKKKPEIQKTGSGRPRVNFSDDDFYELIDIVQNWLDKRDQNKITRYFNLTGSCSSETYISQIIKLKTELGSFSPYLYNESERINQWVTENLTTDGRLRLQRNLSDRRRRRGGKRKIKSQSESRKQMVTVQVQRHVREQLKDAVRCEGAASIDELLRRMLRDRGY